MLDARSKAVAPTVAVSGSSSLEAIDLPTTGPEAVSAIPALEWVIPVAIGLSLIWLAWRAWQYRDAVAAKAQTRFPTLAAKLRSI
jgi:lysozyme